MPLAGRQDLDGPYEACETSADNFRRTTRNSNSLTLGEPLVILTITNGCVTNVLLSSPLNAGADFTHVTAHAMHSVATCARKKQGGDRENYEDF